MERKLFFADAFPHHETCTCKSCLADNEKSDAPQLPSEIKSTKIILDKNIIRMNDRPSLGQR